MRLGERIQMGLNIILIEQEMVRQYAFELGGHFMIGVCSYSNEDFVECGFILGISTSMLAISLLQF